MLGYAISGSAENWVVLLTLCWMCFACTLIVAALRRVRRRSPAVNWTVRGWLAVTLVFGVWFWVENTPRHDTAALGDELVAVFGVEDAVGFQLSRLSGAGRYCPTEKRHGWVSGIRWIRSDAVGTDAPSEGITPDVRAEVEALAFALAEAGWMVQRVEGLVGRELFAWAVRDGDFVMVHTAELGSQTFVDLTADPCVAVFWDRLTRERIAAANAEEPGSVVLVDNFTP